MNPLSINPLHLVAAVGASLLVGLASGFGAGWTANGWRGDSKLATEKASRANEKASQAAATVTTLKADADAINKAATAFLASQQALGPKFDALKKEMRDAKPLPPDCRPDDRRVRNLDAAIDAANAAAAAGQQPGRPVP